MNASVRISTVSALPDLGRMVEASTAEGHRMIARLREEWLSAKNQFTRPGEALFLALVEDELAGVCGVNVDPFSRRASMGRVRNLYVFPEWRALGIGRALVGVVIRHSRASFDRLRVRAGTPEAGKFYEHLGFIPVEEDSATHILSLESVHMGRRFETG